MAHLRDAITSGDLTDLVSSGASATVYPSEDTVLQVLQSRFRGDLPYARVGTRAYVVVNPLKTLANLNDASAKEYEDRCYRDTTLFATADMPRPLQPHCYELAARMYLMMTRRGESQALLVQGVTGSGKSMGQKLVMDQILRLSAKRKKENKIADQIRAFHTLLDSFGNAKTILTPNATRHTRYFELHFNSNGRICGAKALAYALDKTRLVRLGQEERTYHVFYQLLAGASPDEQDALNLEDPSDYALLASSGCYRLPGGMFSDDSAAMGELRAAMASLGFKAKHLQAILSLLISILLMGNLQFNEAPGREESATVANPAVLAAVARHLGVSAEDLEHNLTNRTSYIKKDLFSVFLSADQAREQRDRMVQGLYAILFAFVVETANHKMAGAENPATIISFLDLPGAQGRNQVAGSSSSIQPLIAAQGFSTFDDLSISFSNELVHSFILRNVFDDTVGYNSQITSDGASLPSITTMDNSGCVELLKGVPVPEKVQKKPDGLLGVFHKATTNVKSGKSQGTAKNEEMVTDLISQFGTHPSFVTSPTLGQPSAGGVEKNLFGINHYSGGCTYDASQFLDKNADMMDPAIVSMLRDSNDTFVTKLFSGPSIASENHPKDESVLVQAQVSSRPLRQQSELPMADGAVASPSGVPRLDSGKPYPVTTQINYTLSSLLHTLQSAHLWTMSCIRPNDSGSPNSFDKRRVKFQIRALLIPDTIARRKTDLVADFEKAAFCDRYVPTMQGTVEERLRQCINSNGWKESEYKVGHRNIWLTYGAWKMAEDILRERETSMTGINFDDAESAAPEQESEFGGEPPNPFRDNYMQSQDRLIGSEAGHSLDPRNPFGNSYATGGIHSPMNHSTGDVRADGWDSDYDKKGGFIDSPHAAAELEKTSGIVQKELDGNTVEEIPTSRSRRWWLRTTWAMTWWIPSWVLTHVGRMKRPDVRLAWREKFTICLLIFFLCCLVIFYIIGFGRLLCPNFDKAWQPKEVAQHTGDNDFWVSLHGQVYDLSKFWKQDHSDITSAPATRDVMLQLAGMDLTEYFPPPLTLACAGLVSDPNLVNQHSPNFSAIDPNAIHISGMMQPAIGSALHESDWYVARFLPKLRGFYKGPLVWDKGVVNEMGANGTLTWAIWNDGVYDLSNYFYSISRNPNAKDQLSYLNESVTSLFQQQPGQDISEDLNKVFESMDPPTAKQHNACLQNVFLVGQTDFRKTARCQVQNALLLAFSVLLVTTIAAKFLSALQLSPKRTPEMQDKFVICQVPCYTEGEESLRRTIDSLAALKYDDKRKLMFIICDGNIIGSGNDRPTPRIVLDILGVDPKLDPEPLMFKSVGEGSQQLNYGKVYSGLYEFEGHVVPYMVIVKVGRPTERSRPGNRGKRDSQILLLHYLNHVHFDSPMTPLELEIYHQMRNVIGIDPAFYEYIFTVDADTSVTPESLNRLVACTADDSRIIGICGETKVDNEEGSWWTMIQVYEYYISHHLAKAFESLFGSVTCLPGCFSMFRIRTADKGRPIIISNRIIDEYAENHVDTLHKKNLFSLGEDRYLTTLLMKNFPTYKLKFTPDALASTVAPERWSVLLSQRRRWINSTIHNLCELVFLPELCGFCCFSMRFIVFIDLLGTIILPATTVYLVYLIVITSTGAAAIPKVSLVMIAAVYGLQALIFILKREFMLVGWMVVYILSYPVYSFFLPIYSFWCMDDFSWGNTRLVVGEGNSKKVIMNDDSKFDESVIPLKKFSEYEAEAWEGTNAQDEAHSHSEESRSIAPSRRSAPRGHAPRAGSMASYQPSSQAGDYYRDTNLTHNSSANPNIRETMHRPSLPSMSQHGGMVPPFNTGPPSMAGSMMGGPMPFPQTNSMFMGMGMGLPQVPRGSVMTNLNMFGPVGGGGSVSGHGSTFGMLPARMSTFTNLNPFAGETDPNPNPTDEEIATVLRGYLSSQDLMSVTKKTAREAVMNHFPQADLTPKKDLLNRLIDEILASS